MYPILFSWGPVVLPAWHTLYVLGAILAFVMLIGLARKYQPKIPEQTLSRLFIICYVSGYFGARLLSILVEEPEVKGVGETVMALGRFGAMTFYGGALASFLGGLVYCLTTKLRIADLVDITIPSGLAALALGRVGCFLNGDDYGLPVRGNPWWAVTFPSLQDGVARYPVQLYEAISVGTLVLVLVTQFPKIRAVFRPGAVGLIGIVAYANIRFGLEFFRGDFRGSVLVDWLSTSQFISVCVLAVAGATIPFWIKKAA